MPNTLLAVNPKQFTRNNKIKLFLIVFLFLLLITYHLSLVSAQTPYEKAKNDYSAQIKKYNEAKDNYITTKSNYAAFKTATAKTDAYIKTKDYLVQSNFLIADYLFVIKEFGNQINWSSSTYDRGGIFKTLDDEVNYLQENWRQIQSTSTLEDLPARADELSGHLENSTNPAVNKAMATFEVVKIQYILNNFNQLSQKLINFASPRIKADSRSIINNWQSEIDGIKKETETNLNQAKTDLEKVELAKPNKSQTDRVLESTKKAKDELSKSQDLFKEILRIT